MRRASCPRAVAAPAEPVVLLSPPLGPRLTSFAARELARELLEAADRVDARLRAEFAATEPEGSQAEAVEPVRPTWADEPMSSGADRLAAEARDHVGRFVRAYPPESLLGMVQAIQGDVRAELLAFRGLLERRLPLEHDTCDAPSCDAHPKCADCGARPAENRDLGPRVPTTFLCTACLEIELDRLAGKEDD